jgi:hypothetical protein
MPSTSASSLLVGSTNRWRLSVETSVRRRRALRIGRTAAPSRNASTSDTSFRRAGLGGW